MKQNNTHLLSKNGFTLAELLISISIITVLASFGLSISSQALRQTRDARRIADMQAIRAALELYYRDNGRAYYPGPVSEGIPVSGERIGATPPSNIDRALSDYIKPLPADPFNDGIFYFYSYDPHHCDSDPGSCGCPGGTKAAVFGFNHAETDHFRLRKDTCSGNNQNLDNADYNEAIYPRGN
ncbi:type II secretion system protein [Candidatus Roizmanbacteria bacterium]|nr:type II secretion system protein [Candidatus Roizmanbacteria bacterium]